MNVYYNGKIHKTLYIRSGTFDVTFTNDDPGEMSTLENFEKLEQKRIIGITLSVVLFIPAVVIFYNLILDWIIVYICAMAFAFAVSLLAVGPFIAMASAAKSKLENLKYNYIIYTLDKQHYRILYQNRQTGTITYKANGVKHSISIYKGYNSHYRRS